MVYMLHYLCYVTSTKFLGDYLGCSNSSDYPVEAAIAPDSYRVSATVFMLNRIGAVNIISVWFTYCTTYVMSQVQSFLAIISGAPIPVTTLSRQLLLLIGIESVLLYLC